MRELNWSQLVVSHGSALSLVLLIPVVALRACVGGTVWDVMIGGLLSLAITGVFSAAADKELRRTREQLTELSLFTVRALAPDDRLTIKMDDYGFPNRYELKDQYGRATFQLIDGALVSIKASKPRSGPHPDE